MPVKGINAIYSRLHALASATGRIVALPHGLPGIAATTTDPEARIWTHYNLDPTQIGNWNNLAFGNNTWVAVNSSIDLRSFNVGKCLYSTDGLTWNLSNIGGYGWNDIAFGNGLFVAVGEGSPANRAISTDGINWTTGNLLNFGKWTSITFSNGVFSAVSRFAKDNILFAHSTNGTSWTQSTQSFFPNSNITGEGNKWVDIKSHNNIRYTIAYNNYSGETAYSSNGTSWTVTNITGLNFEGSNIGFDGSNIIFLPYSGNIGVIANSVLTTFSGLKLENFNPQLLGTDFKWTNFLSNIPNINNLMIGYSRSLEKTFALSKNNIYCILTGDSSISLNITRSSQEQTCANNYWISGVTSNARLNGNILNYQGVLNINNPYYNQNPTITSNSQIGTFISGELVLFNGNKFNNDCTQSTINNFPYRDGFRNGSYYRIATNNNTSEWGTQIISIGTDCEFVKTFIPSSSSSSLLYNESGFCSIVRWGESDIVNWDKSINAFTIGDCYNPKISYSGQVYWPDSKGILYLSFDEATRLAKAPEQEDEAHVRVKKAQFYIKNEELFFRYLNRFTGYGSSTHSLSGIGRGIIYSPTGWQPAFSFITGYVTGETDTAGRFIIDDISINERNPVSREEVVDGVAEIIFENLPCTGDCIENKLISDVYLNYKIGSTFANNTIEFDFSNIEVGDGFEIYRSFDSEPFTFIYSIPPQEAFTFSGVDNLIEKINLGDSSFLFSGQKINNNTLKITSKLSGPAGKFFINQLAANTTYGIKIPNRYSIDGEDFYLKADNRSGNFELLEQFEFENSGYYTQFLNITGETSFASFVSGTVWTNNFNKTWSIITGFKEQGDAVTQTGFLVYNNFIQQYTGTTTIISGDGLLIRFTGLQINFIRDNPYDITGNIAAYIISGNKGTYFSGNLSDF